MSGRLRLLAIIRFRGACLAGWRGVFSLAQEGSNFEFEMALGGRAAYVWPVIDSAVGSIKEIGGEANDLISLQDGAVPFEREKVQAEPFE